MGSLTRGRIAAAAAVALSAAVFAPLGGQAASSSSGDDSSTVLGPAESAFGAELVRELPHMRSRTSRTYLASDGSLVARVFTGSVHYRGEGETWEPIDNTLQTTVNGFRNAANSYTATFPAVLALGRVRVERGDWWASFKLRNASPLAIGAAEGPKVHYAKARPGVDVTYEAMNDGIKEELILRDASATRRFEFDLKTAAGLTPRLRQTGGVDFEDASGAVRLSFGAPFMFDASGAESRAVEFDLEQTTAGWRLTTTPNDAWLDDPQREWPVILDPQTNAGVQDDCSLDQDTPEQSACSGTPTMKLGAASGAEHRVLVEFDVQAALPPDVDVLNSMLSLYATGQDDATVAPSRVAAHRVTRSWTPGASWNRHDGTNRWGSPGGDYDSSLQAAHEIGGTRGVNRWYWWDVGEAVSRWTKDTSPQFGVLLKPDGSVPANVISIASAEYSDAAKRPHIDIRYNRRVGERPGYKMETQQLSDRIALKVNPANGNVLVRQTDLTVPGGFGPDMSVGRTYNSLMPFDPAYGVSWTMDTGNDVYLEDHGGGDQYFYGPSGWTVVFKWQWDQAAGENRYKTPPGLDATLVRNGDGSHTLTHNQSQTKYEFEDVADNKQARLTALKDRNGREISFAYHAGTRDAHTITDSQGRQTTI